MKAFTILTLFILFSGFYRHLMAQENKAVDSAANTNQQEAEKYLLQQKEQQRVDSMVTIQLQQELEMASATSRKRKTLEDSLQQLAKKDSTRKAEQLKRISELKQKAKGYPVVLLSDTLFYVYTRMGSFSAAERAEAISAKIKKMYDDAFFKADSLEVVQSEITYDIVYNNDNIILSATDLDALWYNKPADKVADDYLIIIKKEIIKAKNANSLSNWLKRLAYISLIIIGIWMIVFGINRLFRYTTRILTINKEKYFKNFTIRNVQLLSAEQHYKFAIHANNIIRIAIIILSVYLALPLFFGVFPQTKSLADVLWSWITTPAKAIIRGTIGFLPNLFTIAVIYLATRYVIKVIRYFASEIDKSGINIKGFYREWALPTFHIIKFLMYAFMFVIIFPYLPGSKSTAFRGVSVFLGVLLSFGSSSAISNLIAGLVITYMRPFKIGDRVKIGDVSGDVIEKTLLVSRLRTIKNEDITVPNSNILNNYTINYSAHCQDTGLIIHSTVTIGYGVPWKDMHQALTDAAARTEFILPQPPPFVLQTSLDDFFVSYQINAYTREANKQAFIYSQLHQNIQDVCNERGIEIMSPHYNAMRDGNMTTIPHDYLSADYKAPPFNLNVKKEGG